jgi:hypothetical protein
MEKIMTEESLENAMITTAPAHPDMRWYVVHAYSGMEKAVERNILERSHRVRPKNPRQAAQFFAGLKQWPHGVVAGEVIRRHRQHLRRPIEIDHSSNKRIADMCIARITELSNRMLTDSDTTIDKLVFQFLNTVDRSELWADARLNPESYRQAARIALKTLTSKPGP